MPKDIIIETTRKAKLRSDSVIIRNPRSGAKSVVLDMESVDWDDIAETYTENAKHQREQNITIPLDDARYVETYTITDPVTGAEITISVAGIAAAIEAATIAWIEETTK